MDDRFAELLEQRHNRLRSRQEPGNGGVEPRAEIKRRLDEAEECLRLIERVRRAQGCSRSSADPAFRPVESIGPDRCRIGRFEIIVELGRGAHGIVFLAWDPAGATAGCTEDAASGRIVHVGAAKTVPARGYRGRAADARQHYFRARSRSVRTGLLHRQCILRRQVVGRVAGRDYGVHSAARSPHNGWPNWPMPSSMLIAAASCIAISSRPMWFSNPVHWRLPAATTRRVRISGRTGPWFPSSPISGWRSWSIPRTCDRERACCSARQPTWRPNRSMPVRERFGPATDVYGLGAILYELITHRPPFVADSQADLLRQIAAGEPRAPCEWHGDLPRDLEAICLRCLRRRPRDRYASAADLAADLRRSPGRRCYPGTTAGIRRPNLTDERGVGPLLPPQWPSACWLSPSWPRARPGILSRSGAALDVAQAAQAQAEQHGQALQQMIYVSDLQAAHQALEQQNVRKASYLLGRNAPAEERTVVSCGDIFRRKPRSTPPVDGPSRARALRRVLSRRPDFGNRRQRWGSVHLGGCHWTTAGNAPLGRPRGQFCRLLTGRKNNRRGRNRRQTPSVGCRAEAIVVSLGQPGIQQINCLAWSSDGRHLAAAGFPGEFFVVWEVATGQAWAMRPGHSDEVNFLAYSPDGRRLATASSDESVRIWDFGGNDLVRLEPDQTHLTCVRFSPDSQALATSGAAGTVKIWNVADGSLAATHEANSERVDALSFSPHDPVVAFGDHFGILPRMGLEERSHRASHR